MNPYATQLATIAGVVLLGAMSPGPNFVATTAHALASRRTGVFAALGVMTASVVWATLSIAGLGLLLTRVSWLYEAIRLIGAAYLVYLGVKTLWDLRRSAPPLQSAAMHTTAVTAWRRGFLTSMTNPKAAAFFGSLFVTVLPAGAPAWVYGATLLVVALVSGGWYLSVALLLSTGRVRSLYQSGRRAVDAIMGTVLVALGIRLAAT